VQRSLLLLLLFVEGARRRTSLLRSLARLEEAATIKIKYCFQSIPVETPLLLTCLCSLSLFLHHRRRSSSASACFVGSMPRNIE